MSPLTSRGAAFGCRVQLAVRVLVHFVLFPSVFNLKCVRIFEADPCLKTGSVF